MRVVVAFVLAQLKRHTRFTLTECAKETCISILAGCECGVLSADSCNETLEQSSNIA